MKKRLIIIGILILLIGSSLVIYYKTVNSKEEVVVEEKLEQVVEIEEKEEKYADSSLKEVWDNNSVFNEDYIGEVSFESGLLSLPFVCPSKPYDQYSFYTNNGKIVTNFDSGCESGSCSGNDVYLRTDWKTMKYELGGSIFMDYRNTIHDQNIIIYGHHYPKNMDKSRTLFFTPIEKLLLEENYEDNKYVQLVLENSVRRYEIAYVYLFHMTSKYDDMSTLQYYRTNYNFDYYGKEDPGYYQKYIDKMESVKLYDTNVKLCESDNTLTLQTCLENDPTAVEIIVCKEIETLYFK